MWAHWISAWRRLAEARALRRRPIPDALWKRTLARYPFLRRHDPNQNAALRRLTSLFLDRKEFTATGGLRLSDDVVVAIAAQACLPVLHLGLDRYDGFVGIVVHPDQVVAKRIVEDEDGVVHEYDEVLAGEAVEGGPVMLSWRDVRSAGRHAAEGYNVVIHEFAHVLDMADGRANGVPRLPDNISATQWMQVMSQEYSTLRAALDAEQPTFLDPYGGTGAEEFFAVASESFFVSPRELREAHTRLYQMLVRFYRQDPAVEMPMRRDN